jgi:hypothetical protein
MSETDRTPAPETPDDQTPEPTSSPALEGAENAPDTDAVGLRREAASYRRQLRGAETERDRLREQLDTRDRADVERLAGATMADGRDLWAGGVELAALRDPESGALSPELVTEAVGELLEQRPHWRKARAVSFDGGARRSVEPAPSFGQAFKDARRRA